MASKHDRVEKIHDAARARVVDDDRVQNVLHAVGSKLGEGRDRLGQVVNDAVGEGRDRLGEVVNDAVGEGRDRLGEAVNDAVGELREEAEDAMRDARRRARRARRRARKAARSARARWKLPAIGVAGVAAASAVAVGLVKGRARIRSTAGAVGRKVRKAVKRASR